MHGEQIKLSALRDRQPGVIVAGMEALTTIPALSPSLASNPASKPGKTLKITRKVRDAIANMVWEGLKRDEAAKKAGIKDNSLYVAMRRPDVKAYYMRELDVLRTSERARNIHTLTDVRDQTSNQMARVQAVKALEQIDDGEQASRGSQSLPGLQIVIVQGNNQSSIDARLTHATIDNAEMKAISE